MIVVVEVLTLTVRVICQRVLFVWRRLIRWLVVCIVVLLRIQGVTLVIIMGGVQRVVLVELFVMPI